MLDARDKVLIDAFQRDFPLTSRPFGTIGEVIGDSAEGALRRVIRLIDTGVVSRLGVVLRANGAGASTLAAIKAPIHRLEEFAELINQEPGVNHNYEREHDYNLWFVVTGATRSAVDAALQRIGQRTGAKVLDLPLLRAFHIDLGFPIFGGCAARPRNLDSDAPPAPDAQGLELLRALEDGLPLTQKPFLDIARRLDWREDQVIARLGDLLQAGTIKRVGLVVRHRALGFDANAMAVFDVADPAAAAKILCASPAVTLCYERPRREPDWRHNLFAMIHGRDRVEVRAEIARLAAALQPQARAHEVLFSRRCFRQCGAKLSAA